MDLFNTEKIVKKITNLLPYEGVANYYGKILTNIESKEYFKTLLETIEWKNDEVVIFGKHIITQRKVAWYGDSTFSYTYSNVTKQASIWTNELSELKLKIEELSETKYNSCLLNLYHNGNEGMGWHSDDEKSLGKNNIIASLSLGAERKFSFKHKNTKETTSIILENGSLLIMKDATQANWLHSLPKTTKISDPRINLTFRTILV
jgi:alkylated DNA repair dioxygenase AlkB